MKLKLLIVAFFALACSFAISARLLASHVAAQGQKLPGDDVVIPSVDEKWGKVKFTHQKHYSYSDCVFCHHTNNKTMTAETFMAGKEGKVPLCSECHFRKEGDPKTPKNADGVELWSKEAYHFNCIECHQGDIQHKPKDATPAKKQGEGPTKCAECHEKIE
ncbi:MAG: cytochrome c3 family protein [Blastocatellales bacterium]